MRNIKIKNTQKIFLIYIMIPIIIGVIFYFSLPSLLNYPPETINNDFQKEIDGLTYNVQYVFIVFIQLIYSIIILVKNISKIEYLVKQIDKDKSNRSVLVKKLSKLCLTTPYSIYYSQLLIPLIGMPIIFILINANISAIIKICMSVSIFFTLSAVISFIFTKKIFKEILLNIH